MDTNSKLNPLERQSLADKLKVQAVQTGVTGEELGRIFNTIDQWSAGKQSIDHSQTVVEGKEMAMQAAIGGMPDAAFTAWVRQRASLDQNDPNALNAKEVAEIMQERNTKRTAGQVSVISRFEDDLVKETVPFGSENEFALIISGMSSSEKTQAWTKRQTAFAQVRILTTQLRDWIRDNPNATSRDVEKKAQELRMGAGNWMGPGLEKPVSEPVDTKRKKNESADDYLKRVGL
jgi:hypothetical protein